MEEIKRVKENFDKYNKTIDELVNIGFDISEITLEMLKNLKKENEEFTGFIPYKRKLDIVIKQIENIKDHKLLKEKYKIIYRHALVLVVSNFESFMSSLFKELIDHYPDKIIWPEKKKIGIDLSMLNYATPSIGDLIAKSLKGEVNFQDLQSTLRFLDGYLKLEINLSGDNKEKIILYQAMRHIIIHNSGIVDADFLKQIRGTQFKDQYNNGEEIKIGEREYNDARDIFSDFVNQIIEKLVGDL